MRYFLLTVLLTISLAMPAEAGALKFFKHVVQSPFALASGIKEYLDEVAYRAFIFTTFLEAAHGG